MRAVASVETLRGVEARLEVREGAETRVIALAGRSTTIGRDPTCDIVLGAPWIAPQHARFESIAGAHRVIASAGAHVLVGGAPVDEQLLQDGDVVRISDPTTGSFVGLVYANALAPRVPAVQHFATPPGKALLTIGRANADLVLDQPLVSLRHAELLWQDGGHVLRDDNSTHGTYVNGELVRGDRRLKPGDVVQIGTFRLTYDGDSLDAFDQRGVIRLDARGLERIVEGGKVILDRTTLSIEPCEFVGLVGASGAGKSTLMMALCGFQPADHGSVQVNGDDFYAGFDAYRSILGYVPQDDILHRSLPVDRALRYTARLRLPSDTAPEEIEARISKALDAVDMSAHRTKLVDQLSGGQRKRVSIAAEMLGEPSLLFLDEPTSGLDPGLERKMMYTLRKLADGGRTVVLVTHATANIRQCDHIVFMAAGRAIWFGPPFQALEFFGVEDFADVYTKTEGRVDPASPIITKDLAAEWAAWQKDHPGAPPPPVADLWLARYRGTLQYQKYAIERLGRAPERPSQEQSAEKERRARAFAHSPWRQLAILTRRYLDLIWMDRKNLALLLAQAPVIGVLLALVSQHGSLTTLGKIEAKKLLFMLATVGVWFGVINSAREICKETAIFRRERLAGMRAGPYVASKVIVLFLLVLVQSALLLAVLAARVRLPSHGVLMPGALELYLTASLAGLAGIAVGLCISVVAATPDKATSLIPIVLVPQVLFAGLMFHLRHITAVLSWFTTSRWAMDAMGAITRVNEIKDRLPLPSEAQYAATPHILLRAWGVMGAHALGCSLVAWIALLLRKR
jgi:ABC-type multidrug transport system ATPase subunit/pSer/pThr/pTyr-binding forkhead associated (FHA) protein